MIDYAHRFGVTANIPVYLPVALGSAEITPLEQTSAFSVFPNDGVRVAPRYITKVTDYEGRILEEDFSDIKDAVSSRTARIMTSMLREVVLHGTAVAAAKMPTPGSWGFPRRSPAASGSATTKKNPSARKRREPAPRCPSGCSS